jgi:hypothetical protein
VDSAEHYYKLALREEVDVGAAVPYAAYYFSYQAANYNNRLGDQFGAIGHVTSRVLDAPLAAVQVTGLTMDAGIDIAKETTGIAVESPYDEGRMGYLNPLHGILPASLRGPRIYLPGIHPNGSVDIAW